MYVISYDIENNKIRNKISKELQNYGRRVQYSVFECRISEKNFKVLYNKLVKIMEKEIKGSIRIYKLCANCDSKIMTIGIKKENMNDFAEIYII